MLIYSSNLMTNVYAFKSCCHHFSPVNHLQIFVNKEYYVVRLKQFWLNVLFKPFPQINKLNPLGCQMKLLERFL